MEEKIYLICGEENGEDIKGYIKGTEEDAIKWCDAYNATHKNYWEIVSWVLLENLMPKGVELAREIEKGTTTIHTGEVTEKA